jgi:hypothetical protein
MYLRKSPERFGNAFSRGVSIRQLTVPNQPDLLAMNEVCLASGPGTLAMRVVSVVVYPEAVKVAPLLALPTWQASAAGTTHSSRPFAGRPVAFEKRGLHCVSSAKNTNSRPGRSGALRTSLSV